MLLKSVERTGFSALIEIGGLTFQVVAVGYPMHASTVTLTRGVVSNVHLKDLSLGNMNESQLCVQIDAAINPGAIRHHIPCNLGNTLIHKHTHTHRKISVAETDLTMSAGNSGGPVFNQETNKVVGVAFAGLTEAEGTGYIIPTPVVKNFISVYVLAPFCALPSPFHDRPSHVATCKHTNTPGSCQSGCPPRPVISHVHCWRPMACNLRASLDPTRGRYEKSGDFEGLPSLGVHTQDLVNASLRKFAFGSETKHSDGVLIQKIQPFSSAKNAGLREGDILMAIDGQAVSQEGEVSFRGHERVGYEYLISKRPLGDTVKLSVLRKEDDGEITAMDVNVELTTNFALVPRELGKAGFAAHYVVAGGLVLLTASVPLMKACLVEQQHRIFESIVKVHRKEYDCEDRDAEGVIVCDCLGIVPSKSPMRTHTKSFILAHTRSLRFRVCQHHSHANSGTFCSARNQRFVQRLRGQAGQNYQR